MNYKDFETAGDLDTFVYNGKVYDCLTEYREETNNTAVILVEQGYTDWQYVVEFGPLLGGVIYVEEAA
tara:strand:+ start:762 stop:965 length:204 start_codon:yes stop_codon:yes gene_type:complete